MPRPRLAGFTARRSRPSSRIAPPLGSTKPAIICSVVVLPQPEGPSRETNSPFSTPSVRPSTAAWVPKRLLSPSSDRNAISSSDGGRSPLHLAVPALGPVLALGVDDVPVGRDDQLGALADRGHAQLGHVDVDLGVDRAVAHLLGEDGLDRLG